MSSDFSVIHQVSKEIREDPNPPVFDHHFDVTNEVACELALYEADFFVEQHLEKYRTRFSDALMFESFVRAYQKNFRTGLKDFIQVGRLWVRDMGFEEGEEEG